MRITALILLLALPCIALTIHVPGDLPTIQEGLDAASDNDTVLVASGIYYENIVRPETYGVKLIGSGQGDCIIDGGGAGTVVLVAVCLDCPSIDSATLISGFTIQNGRAINGGGFDIGWNNDLAIEHVTISNNISIDNGSDMCGGGGMKCYFCRPQLKHVTISNNVAARGGGVHCHHADPLFEFVTIINNFATRGSGIYSLAELSSPSLVNSTVFGNGGLGTIYLRYQAGVNVQSSIIWGNGSYSIFNESGWGISVTCSNISGGWEGLGNICADPLFCDPDCTVTVFT